MNILALSLILIIVFPLTIIAISVNLALFGNNNKSRENWSIGKIWGCDIVYRWCNPEYVSGKVQNIQRYRDNNELLYSLRSFSKLIGVRYFHIIGVGPPPKWLNINHPRIHYHNEKSLLKKFAIENNFDPKNINVSNSETCKYTIPYLENLHTKRFILVDDDYLLRPASNKNDPQLTTSIFFNNEGIPYHPTKIADCHIPLGFLTEDYAYILENDKRHIKNILTDSTNRNDPLIRLSSKFHSKLVTEPTRKSILWWITYLCNERNSLYFLSHNPMRITYIKKFFNAVEKIKPLFVTINDDWPKRSKKRYIERIEIFNNFRNKYLNNICDWELNSV